MRAPRTITALLLAGGLALAAGPSADAVPRDAAPTTLQVFIADIKPVAPVQTSTLIVTGKVTNPGSTPVFAMSVALNNVDMAGSRQTLEDFEANPTLGGTVLVTAPFPKGLAGGASVPFTLKLPMVGQFLDPDLRDLVYELTVTASGEVTKGGASATLGVAGLPLPYFPSEVKAPLHTALIIPITAIPDQGPYALLPNQPASPDLITALKAPDGRLDKLLSVAMAAAPPGGVTGGTQLTLALDPALIERVCALAGKCRQHPPAGTGVAVSQIAGAWLSKLTNAVNSPDITVVGLPYADADIGAMTTAGDTRAVDTLLSEAGASVDTGLSLATTTTDLQPLLPVDGLADDALASAAKQAGSTVAVLSDAVFEPAVPAATGPPTVTASTSLQTSAGDLPVLVTDPTLQRLLLAANPALTPRLQEQELLAELAVITSEAPNYIEPRTVVLEAPRDWDVPLAFSTHLVDALGAVSYVFSEGLGTLQGAKAIPRERAKTTPQSEYPPLPGSAIATIDNERPAVNALHQVAADRETEVISPPFGEGLDRMLSAWWRGPNAAQGAALLTSITNDLTEANNKVMVVGNPKGVLLTGPSGTLPVQVINELEEPIAIVVHVKSDGLDQVTGRDKFIRLNPGSARNQVSVQITTRSTRSVAVTLQLLAQSDRSQVAVATIRVRSTSVGKVAVGITATALTFLVLLILFRAGRRITASRRGTPTP